MDFRHIVIKHNMKSRKFSPTRIIIFVFIAIIAVGTLLLMLPVSSASGEFTDPFTALFTATSATCVTGLVVRDTYAYWSTFGQIIILIMIQAGGLGFMSIVSIFFFLMNKKIGLRERLLMMQSLNLNDLGGVVSISKHILLGTLIFEGLGAAILSLCFVPAQGLRGIWMGIFHSVSAFCNAGFDIIGSTSVMPYSNNPIVLLTLAALVVIGGLGFFVWEDLIRLFRRKKRLTVYTKIVLVSTGILLAGGTVCFLITEYANPETLGGMSAPYKLLHAFFQSVTTRTAGFDAVGQEKLTDTSKMLSIILMLIGGSGGSTAGGIKTVTVSVLFLSVIAAFRGKRELVIFGRRISDTNISNAVAVAVMGVSIALISGMLISFINGIPMLDSLYEAASAYGTVGLTSGVTGAANTVSKVILIICMFAGKVGVTTISVAFMVNRSSNSNIRYPSENIMIG